MCLLGFFSAASMRRGFMARAANGMVIQAPPCAVSAGTATLMEHLAFGGKVQGWAPEPLARPSSPLSPRVSAFPAARGRESHFGYPSWGTLWPHGQLLEAVHPAVGAGRWASPAECADESVKPRRSVEEDTRVKSAAYGHPTHLYFGGAVHQWRLPKTATSAIRGFVFCDLCELWLCLHDGRTDGRTDGWMWLAYKIEYEFYRYLDIFHRPSERSFNPFNRRLYLWLRLRQPPKERAGEFQWLHSGLRTAAAGAALAIKLKQFTFGHIFTSFSASKAAASHSDSDS